MKKNYLKKLTTAFVFTLFAAIGTFNQAYAQNSIVHVDLIPDVEFGIFGNKTLDLDGDGNNDITFDYSWTFGQDVNILIITSIDGTYQPGGVYATEYDQVKAFNSDEVISSAGMKIYTNSSDHTAIFGQEFNSGKYIGVQFSGKSGGNTQKYIGWIKYQHGGTCTISEYAYKPFTGTGSIRAGQLLDDATTSVANSTNSSMEVFGMPAGNLRITSSEVVSVDIYSTSGILLKSINVNSGINTLNTQLKAGAYIVKLTANNQKQIVKKIVLF